MKFGKKKIEYTINSEVVENNNQTSEWLLFLKDLIIIGITVLIIRTFIAVPFQISGYSMSESYYDKEFIIVDRFSYIIGSPKRGDVIVFKPGVNKKKEYFLKRIIGIPGDTLKIENGSVAIKKKGQEEFIQLEEKYLNTENSGATFVGYQGKGIHTYSLGTDQYFVMGDNRNHSTDSRECFGNCLSRDEFITKGDMTGRLFFDLGYFNIKEMKFIHPKLGISTVPRLLNTPKTYDYKNLFNE